LRHGFFILPTMQQITAIEPQKRNKKRVNIYVDHQYAFSLTAAAAADLTPGQLLTPARQAELDNREELEQARQKAYNYLSYRPRSTAEIQTYLAQKEVPEPIIKTIIAGLQQQKMLDDHAFADYWVEQRETFKPRGQIALRQELRQKGIDNETIEHALADLDEHASAIKAANTRLSRWGNLPWEQFRQKMGNFLLRRGFSYQLINPVLHELRDVKEKGEL